MQPIFCIFAHPDDEAFGPGGTIATFAKEHDVYIICVTDGHAKEDFQHIKHDNLGEIRKNELLASAKILGVKDVFFLGYSDGGLCNNVYHEIAGEIETIIESYQPDTLVTFENRGVSGHLDHVAVSLITTYVFQNTPYVKKLLYYCESEAVIGKLRGEYFIYMPQGYKKSEVDLIINTEAVWETKMRAMSVHHSQQKDIDTNVALLTEYPKEEYFLVKEK